MKEAEANKLFDFATLEQLRARVEHYPYYQTARLLYLQTLQQHKGNSPADELERASLFMADRSSLFFLTHADETAQKAIPLHTEPREVRQSEPNIPDDDRRTWQTAPAVGQKENDMMNLPPQAPQSANADRDSRRSQQSKRRLTVVDAATDYMAYMLQDEQEEPENLQTSAEQTTSHTEQLIDNFIEHSSERISLSPTPMQLPDVPTTEEEQGGTDEDYFTETLSRIYIKQGRYEQAIEIIHKLMLDYPKKNSYFADQIRFLEKLIINNKTTK